MENHLSNYLARLLQVSRRDRILSREVAAVNGGSMKDLKKKKLHDTQFTRVHILDSE